MEEYYQGIQRALERPEVDFVGMLLWGFAIFIAILFIFLIGKFIKAIITQNVQQMRYYSMDFEALKQMLERGLLSEEEYQRIRKKVAERLAEQMAHEAKPEAQGPSVAIHRIAATGPPATPRETPVAHGAEPDTSKAGAPSRPAGRPPSAAKKPLDLDGMFKAGLITPEEYEKLRQFFRDKEK